MPVLRFHLIDLYYSLVEGGFIVTCTTNAACHLYLRYSGNFPFIHRKPVSRRGLVMGWDARYCFTAYHHIEQNEPGDVWTHTFTWPGWVDCERRYFYFWGTMGGQDMVSDTPIFWLHYLWEAPPLIIREGITKFALREGNYECTGIEPPYNRYKTSNFRIYMRDDIRDHWPFLKITYHLPGGPPVHENYYPTPGSDGVAADGRVSRTKDNSSWAQIRAGEGTVADPSGTIGYIGFTCGGTLDTWYTLYRTLLHFDTLRLPAASIIDAASVAIHGVSKSNTIPSIPSLALVESVDPRPGDITLADYQNTKSDLIAPVISYDNFDPVGWNVIVLPESTYSP